LLVSGVTDLKPVTHHPLHERVYRELMRSLMNGSFAPGEPLTVRSVSAALSVSPMPVRAALSRLTAQGALSLVNGTATVPLMTKDRFLEIREVRMEIEGLAAEKAALTITPEELREVKRLCDELTAATHSGDEVVYREKNRRLRFAVYQAAQSATLLGVIEALWLQVGPFLVYVTKNLSIHHEIDHHYALLAALQVRDGAAARRALVRDTFESGELLLSVGSFSPPE
jgi:DNA-binding GntR family transcriptional regulator